MGNNKWNQKERKEKPITLQSRLQNLLRPEPVSILILSGPDLRIKMVNQTFLKLIGNEEVNIKNKPFFDLYPLVRDRFISIIRNVLQSGTSYYGEEVKVPVSFNKEETSLYLDIILHSMPSERGSPDTVMVIILDVTEKVIANKRKIEKEARIKKMIQESRVCMLLLRGEDFIIDYGNDRMFTDILSIKPGDALGRPFLRLFPELDIQGFREQLNKVFFKGEIVYQNEMPVTMHLAEGEKEFFFNYELAPLRNEQDKVTAIMVSMNDVTDQVSTRLLQEENQHMIEESLDSGGVALWEWNLKTRHLTLAAGLAELIDRNVIESGMNGFLEYVYPPDKERFQMTTRQGLQKGNYTFEGRFFTKFRNLVWLRIHGKVFYDQDGEPVKLVGSTRDITLEKKERLELERKEHRLKTLIYQAPVSIAILRGPDHKVEIINAAALKLLGRTENDIKGKSFTKVLNEIDTDEAQRLLDLVYHNNEVITANEYPIRFLRDGRLEKLYVNFECHPTVSTKGRTIGIMVVAYEVTNLVLNRKKIEESESRFRILAESTRNFVSYIDTNGKMTYTNKTFTRFTGYTIDDFNEKGYGALVHPDDAEKSDKRWRHAMKSCAPYINEQRLKKKNGTYHWFITTAIPQTDSAGKVLGWVFNSTDIQEIKEQELQKDYFIVRASHELKTPMTSIKGYIQILKLIHENTKDTTLIESLEKMDFQVNKLTHLIDDLLDTTRISKDGLKINLRTCLLNDIIKNSIDEVRIFSDRDIAFKSATEHIKVLVDHEKIGQVITNLLTNAIKYSPGNEKIMIKSEISESKALITIEDKGIGIPPHAQKKIFEKFYRVSGKNEETFPGLGIGLYIANEILKKHESRIHVKSKLGKGSAFYFYLNTVTNDVNQQTDGIQV